MPSKFDLLRHDVVADAALYTSPNDISPDEANKVARALHAKVRKGQSVTYVTPEGHTFRMTVRNVTGTKVTVSNPSFGGLLVDLIQFKPNSGSGSQWLVYGQPAVPPATTRPSASEAAMIVEANGEDLNVLKDKKVHSMLQKLYQTYISDHDFGRLPSFISAIDSVFMEFRGGVPLELQPPGDDEDGGSEQQSYLPDANGPSDDDEDMDDASNLDAFSKEVQATFAYVNYDERTFRQIKASLSRHLVTHATASLAHPAVKELRNHAIKMGFTPHRNPTPLKDHKHLFTLHKQAADKHVMVGIYQHPESGKYVLTKQHTRRGAKPDELIRPWKKTYPGPKSLRKHGKAILRKYS